MALADDLKKWVGDTFASDWEVQETTGVPNAQDLRLNSNHAKDLNAATVLYADLDGSTDMVNTKKWEFSAEIYKTFLKCASDIIKDEDGVITAYDGDRVMAVFTGGSKNTSATRCALRINAAVLDIIQPSISKGWTSDFVLKHVVGIDTSRLRTARIGVRGDNDLVWIGRAANYAAKLTNLAGKPTRITADVYNLLADNLKYTNGVDMWVKEYWSDMDIWTYNSTWKWAV
ncbi:Pycsar phage resistance system uridylate cyclase PycC [Paraburkholderia sp. BL17N1]|uniref:Pycsar phage resistance system uridylate cyclase PycC n=1 Tax=Paraburkholderia sp. BL17N1 TaxID=1938798 RepID=UPI000EB36312|nr:Pycsar phage resistance system uridylate cyclase PycC [Paraburkholderia sp. BL17N1]RKR36206.1 adenylate/guanylate cyclase family protein [Paraburkholderia sp. BL17N1]